MIYECRCGRRFSYGAFEYNGRLPITQLESCSACDENENESIGPDDGKEMGE